MRHQPFQKILGGSLALFLLGGLVTQSLSIDSRRHQQYQTLLAQQTITDSTLNQRVLKARYALLNSYDPLVRAISTQLNLQARLEQAPSYISNQQVFQKQWQSNQTLFLHKEELLEDFKSKNAVVKNSLTYLPGLVKEIRQSDSYKQMSRSTAIQLQVMLDNVLLYSLSTDEGLETQIKNQMSQLEALSTAKIDPTSDRILLAIAHTRIILKYKPEVDRLTRRILELPTADAIGQLERIYTRHYQDAVQTVEIYRLLSFCYLLAIVGGIAYLVIQHQQGLIREQKRSKQRLSGILRSLTDAFISLTPQWKVSYINPKATEILKQDAQDLLDHDFWQIFPEELGSRYRQVFQTTFQEQAKQSFEVFYSPHQIWYEVRVFPSVDGLSVFFQDVTTRKRAEINLKQVNAQLQAAKDHL